MLAYKNGQKNQYLPMVEGISNNGENMFLTRGVIYKKMEIIAAALHKIQLKNKFMLKRSQLKLTKFKSI